MIRLKFICVILFILPIFCKGQSICIDSSTLKNANIYLIKGAKARELNNVLYKIHKIDSLSLIRQDSIIVEVSNKYFKEVEYSNRLLKITKYSIILNIIFIIWKL